jgi:hypothetical protein
VQQVISVTRSVTGNKTSPGIAFFLFLILWSFGNWPALKQAWLFQDDYPRITEISESTRAALDNGRPFEILWFLTFNLERRPDWQFYNIALRFFQGIIHCLAATIAAFLIWKQSQRWIALASVLPFLLWPFNGEAVLWRMAGEYPIAAFLSILGVYLLGLENRFARLNKLLATVLICIAVWANQLAAFAGFVVWLVLIGLNAANDNRLSLKNQLTQFFYLASGYIIGGCVSLLIIHRFEVYGDRSRLATDLLNQLSYLFELDQSFIFSSSFYPLWLIWLHGSLLVGSLALFGWNAYQQKRPWKSLVLPILIFVILLAIPYTPVLLLEENWPAWRIMYLAPFIFVVAINLMDIGSYTRPILRWAAPVWLGIMVIGYLPLARVNSSEYVDVFQKDLGVLHQIEATAADWGIDQVAVAAYPDYIYDWNPYQVKYMNAESKLSVYLIDYTWNTFLPLFSTLPAATEEPILKECVATCTASMRDHTFEFYKLDQSNTMCVCP